LYEINAAGTEVKRMGKIEGRNGKIEGISSVEGDRLGVAPLSTDGRIVAVGRGGSYSTPGRNVVDIYGITGAESFTFVRYGNPVKETRTAQATAFGRRALALSGRGNTLAVGAYKTDINTDAGCPEDEPSTPPGPTECKVDVGRLAVYSASPTPRPAPSPGPGPAPGGELPGGATPTPTCPDYCPKRAPIIARCAPRSRLSRRPGRQRRQSSRTPRRRANT